MDLQLGCVLGLMTLLSAAAVAAPVPIVNHSFEDPALPDGGFLQVAPGWTRTATFCGVFNPSSAAFPAGAPDGQNVAFLDAASTLTQTLGTVLQPHTTYTLTVEYGSQLSFAGLAPSIRLSAGPTANYDLVDSSGTTPAPAGTFQTLTITYETSEGHAAMGTPITIVLGTAGPGVQVDYDNIRLDATPLPPGSGCVSLRQYLAPPNPAMPGNFGLAVAASDDTAVVFGGPDQTLHFYSRVGDTWTLAQTLPTPPASTAEPSLAIEGDTLVYGASRENVGATINAGAAHVFQRTNGVWAYDERLSHPPVFGGKFGIACDIQGDRILVGSPNVSAGTVSTGAIYVYRRSGSTWVSEAVLNGSNTNELAGLAVALDGEFAFVGTQLDGVRVFKRSGTDWAEVAPIIGALSSGFGRSLDADNGTLIVGAPNQFDSLGSAHVFRRLSDHWIFVQSLEHPDPDSSNQFGAAVRLSQGRAAILSSHEWDEDSSYGALCVFEQNPFTWVFRKRIEKFNPNENTMFHAVALAGRQILMADESATHRLVAVMDIDSPAITQQPQNQIAEAGDAASLSVQTTALFPLFQWRKDGVPLVNGAGVVGADTGTLTIDPVNASHTGIYDCVIASGVGCASVLSAQAIISVSTPPCPGDANGDQDISFADIAFVLQNWNVPCR